MLNFHNKYSYKTEEAVQSNTKRCFLFVPFDNRIRHRFGVTGSHDVEDTDKIKPLTILKCFSKTNAWNISNQKSVQPKADFTSVSKYCYSGWMKAHRDRRRLRLSSARLVSWWRATVELLSVQRERMEKFCCVGKKPSEGSRSKTIVSLALAFLLLPLASKLFFKHSI